MSEARRRLTSEHRLVYVVFDDRVTVVQARYHYRNGAHRRVRSHDAINAGGPVRAARQLDAGAPGPSYVS